MSRDEQYRFLAFFDVFISLDIVADALSNEISVRLKSKTIF